MSILLDIIVPVFGLVGVGFGARAAGVFGDTHLKGLSLFAFGFAIPALLFRSMATMELEQAVAWPFLLSYYLSAFALFALGTVTGRLVFRQDLGKAAIGGMSGAYSNTVLLGIPLLLTAFGDAASLPVFLLVAFHSALMFPLVTAVLEIARNRRERLRDIPIATASGLLRNPILGGLVLGLLWNFSGFELPAAVDGIARTLGRAAVPCALFAMGASLVGYRLGRELIRPAVMTAFKLMAFPGLVWLLGSQVFLLQDLWLKVAVVMAGLPTGVNVYIFAQRYEAGAQDSAAVVLLSTTFSLVSLSLLLVWTGAR